MEKVPIVSKSPLFEMLSAAELEYLAELSQPRQFPADHVIFEEGDLGDSVFVIVSGEVEVLRRAPSGESRLFTVLNPPEFFGEMSLIDKEYRSATIRAKTDVELLQLTAENLTSFRKQFRDGFTFVVINIARVISARLRKADEKIASQL